MNWIAYLSLALTPLTIADRLFHSSRFWWAPLFGLAIQVPWAVYGVDLARSGKGHGVWVMAVVITSIYLWNMRKWLRSRNDG